MKHSEEGISDVRKREPIAPDSSDLMSEHKCDIAISICFLEVIKE